MLSDQPALGFSFDMGGFDRTACINEAAEKLDILTTSHLGGSTAATGSSKEGDIVRSLLKERASLPAFPDVYKITNKDYLARQLNAPVRFTQLSKDFNFYWIRFPVGLIREHNWTFNRIEVHVEFNPGEAKPERRPKAYQILPHKKFQNVAQADQALTLRFDENFELSADTGPIGANIAGRGASLDASVDGVAKGGFGVVLGPFKYRVTRAKIDHNTTGLEWVFWRLDGVEFSEDEEQELVVVAQVPKTTKNVKVIAALQAYHSFKFLPAALQSAASQLPKVLREYFQGGAPLRDERSWDLKAAL